VGDHNTIEDGGVKRIDHLNDPDAPAANLIVPGASAVVLDEAGRILLHRRDDNELWSIPGGGMEVGERIADTVVREVREETGLEVEPEAIVGIYSNPQHVVEYGDGEIRQQFSVCFACRLVGGELATSDESLEVGFFTPPRSKPCRCTSQSGCASTTTWSTDLSPSSPD
jgi:ADP-ribose pyrophosphatase YjhB (NUDIX family)